MNSLTHHVSNSHCPDWWINQNVNSRSCFNNSCASFSVWWMNRTCFKNSRLWKALNCQIGRLAFLFPHILWWKINDSNVRDSAAKSPPPRNHTVLPIIYPQPAMFSTHSLQSWHLALWKAFEGRSSVSFHVGHLSTITRYILRKKSTSPSLFTCRDQERCPLRNSKDSTKCRLFLNTESICAAWVVQQIMQPRFDLFLIPS